MRLEITTGAVFVGITTGVVFVGITTGAVFVGITTGVVFVGLTTGTVFVGFTKESLKVVQNFRNHQRYDRSRETEAIIEAKFQLVSLSDI